VTLARVGIGGTAFVDIQEVSAQELLQDALESFHEVARSYGVELVEENAAPGRIGMPTAKRSIRYFPT